MSDYHNFYLKMLETNNFDISFVLSTKIINLFIVFTSFPPPGFAYWHPYLVYILS